MPLYSRVYSATDSTAEFYEVIKDKEIKLTCTRTRVVYERPERFIVDSSLKVNSVSWDAPYIPDVEASVSGALSFSEFWRFRGSVRYFGKHYIENGKNDREDGFVTIDVGVDRELWDEHLRLYVDLRNMTDSEGAWWTNRYEIPGAGLYAGLKLDY